MYLISGRFANRAREGKLEVINDPGILLVNLDFRDFLIFYGKIFLDIK